MEGGGGVSKIYNHHKLEYQAVRRCDGRVVSWLRDLTGDAPHLSPATRRIGGDYESLDMRVQWNESEFYAKCYPEDARGVYA